jgi:hypothetical protein
MPDRNGARTFLSAAMSEHPPPPKTPVVREALYVAANRKVRAPSRSQLSQTDQAVAGGLPGLLAQPR